MSYEFNSADTLLNDVANPFRFENTFMLLTAALTMAGAVDIILTAKSLFQAHSDGLAGATLGMAMVLGGVSMSALIQAMSQMRFFLGREFPLGLAGELPVTETGVGVGTEQLLDTLRHRAIDFPEPKGALNGVLYSLVKDLITSPPQVQAAAVQHFQSILQMVALLISLVVSYTVFAGTAYDGMASWLYLPLSGLSLLTPFMNKERLSVDASTQETEKPPATNAALWKLLSLVVFSIMAPVAIPRVLPAFSVPPMWIAPALLLAGSIVASTLFFCALVSRLDRASHTNVSCEQTTIAMNCAPAQLWTAISRDFQTGWARTIPNRAYANVPPDVSEGERGSFGGFIVEETQPVPTSTTQFSTWAEAAKVTSARYLMVLGAWGVACAAAASFVGVYYAGRFAEMERMQVSRVILVVIALSVVAVLSHKVGHLLWSRMQFKSRVYWIETSGTYQTSTIAVGNQFKGYTQSSSTLTRIEDATLRVWVTDIVSVVFGKDGKRNIIAMASADSIAKGIADRLVTFAAAQSSVAMPTANHDLDRARSIGVLDAAVSSAVADAKRMQPVPRKDEGERLIGSDSKVKGRVKFFNAERGFGFIDGDDGQAYFFNANYLNGEVPRAGADVEFNPGQSARGAIAKHVSLASKRRRSVASNA